MSDQIKAIVQGLNKPPFKMKLTLVTLDSKKGLDLLQVVNDVFAYLNPKQRRDVKEEDPVLMGARMMEFIVALNYKSMNEVYVPASIASCSEKAGHCVIVLILCRLCVGLLVLMKSASERPGGSPNLLCSCRRLASSLPIEKQ